jgi:hypothetical protein
MSGGVMWLALRETHAAFGATLGVRRGWEVPLAYGDPEGEYRALRENALLICVHNPFPGAGRLIERDGRRTFVPA